MAAPSWGGSNGTVATADSYLDLNVTKWTLTEAGDVHDITKLGDSARSFVAGLTGWSGTFEGYAENLSTGTNPPAIGGAAAAATFTTGGSDTLAGNIIITSAEWETGIDGPDMLRCAYQGTSTLTKTGVT